jgi:hypothetical protein
LETRSWEALVATRHIPRKGFAALRKVLDSQGERFVLLCRYILTGEYLSDERYSFVMQFVTVALYLYNPQGRQLAISKLTLRELNDLVSNGGALSRSFKTRKFFDYQTISASFYITRILLELYRDIFRCRAINNRQLLVGAKAITKADNKAGFLTYYGRRVTADSASRLVSSFFKDYGRYNTTTTDIRIIQITEVR